MEENLQGEGARENLWREGKLTEEGGLEKLIFLGKNYIIATKNIFAESFHES